MMTRVTIFASQLFTPNVETASKSLINILGMVSIPNRSPKDFDHPHSGMKLANSDP